MQSRSSLAHSCCSRLNHYWRDTSCPGSEATSAVWITCMLFFQLLLVAGYAYSHLIATRLTARRQAIVHVAIVFACVLLMGALALIWQSPITPGPTWKPLSPDFPVTRIFVLLLLSIGLPFFILSTTGPLLQAWYARSHQGVRALSTVRTIQYRIVARPGDLSIRGGTGSEPESTSASVVAAVLAYFRSAYCYVRAVFTASLSRIAHLTSPNPPTCGSRLLPDRRASYGSRSLPFHR